MTPVTVTVDQLIGWSVTGYTFLHLMFGLVTHYHSVAQVRAYNAKKGTHDSTAVPVFKMFVLFVTRMLVGFPWFIASRMIAPIGNRWHWTPEQISKWVIPIW